MGASSETATSTRRESGPTWSTPTRHSRLTAVEPDLDRTGGGRSNASSDQCR